MATSTAVRLVRETRQSSPQWNGFVELPQGPAAIAPGGEVAKNQPVPAVFIVEPLNVSPAQILLLSPAGRRALVNGQPAPRVAILRVADEVILDPDDGTTLHVTAHHKPSIAAPTPEQIGNICPICRTRFAPDTLVYTCACGTAMHCENDGPDALQCARIARRCANCGGEVVMSEGWAYLPEGYTPEGRNV